MPTAYGANNHGSMVQIGDDWYIFYHRHTNGTWYSRQGCAERLTFGEDGSIFPGRDYFMWIKWRTTSWRGLLSGIFGMQFIYK